MAITQTSLTSGGSSTNAASYSSSTISPGSNRLILATVGNKSTSGSPATPTCSGVGLTWVQVGTVADVANRRTTVFRALGSSPGSGALTFDFGGTTQDACSWSITEFAGVDTTGTNGSGAIVQAVTGTSIVSATSITITLSSFASADNATFGGFTISGGDEDVIPGSGFTEIHDTTRLAENIQVFTEWRADNDTTVDCSYGSTTSASGVAVEIKASGLSVTPAHITSTATVHAPTVTSVLEVNPSHILSTATVHAPTVHQEVTPDHIAAASTVHAPSLVRENEVVPDFIAGTSSVHAPTLTPGAVTVTPDHIASAAQVHAPAVSNAVVWSFRTPARITEPVGDHPLLRRVVNYRGVALVKHADGSWAEYDVLPDTVAANADYMFGRGDRSSLPVGKGFSITQMSGEDLETPEDREYQSPQRIFLGGHVYYISDAMKAELEAAVTTEEPTGYGGYVVSVEGNDVTEDEIALSGRHIDHEQGTSSRGSEDGYIQPIPPNPDVYGWGDGNWNEGLWND